jgi:aspartate aminotransferase
MSKLSQLSETLIGSEIVRLGNEISARIKGGETIYNFTIGDFAPSIFPIPIELENEIIAAYQQKQTNYPAGEGILALRESVSAFLLEKENISYSPNEIQIASGGRPLIYSIYRAIVDKGDKVIYPIPSWNNNHYVHFTEGQHVVIETLPENKFMPKASDIAPHIKGATLLALCSPLNPTGTTFSKQDLEEICDLIIAENATRSADEKKCYLLYDQIYWTLTHANTVHYNPVSLRPEMKEFTIFVDGISKSFSATGVRVGWSMGPASVIAKVKAILSHIGAWAPMAEQVATAKYLTNFVAMDSYFEEFKKEIAYRLQGFHDGFQAMKAKGFSVDSITPEAAIYLTVKVDMLGKKTQEGKVLATQLDVWQYILDTAKVAFVPFSSFGADKNSPWYRISVGTSKKEEMPIVLAALENAFSLLTDS